MTKLKIGLALGAVVLLAGCAGGHENERWPQVPAARPAPVYVPPAPVPPAQPSPVQSAPAPAQAPQSPAQSLRPVANDQCGASALQYLVGRPRTEIPVPLQPSTRRVVCSSCVITQDYRADRQTIVFDSDTGLIKSVACG
jgi:hypothetical protein